jgi:hypothetical protein
LCLGQNPIETTVCEIVQTPETFSGKIVKLNARVILAFEDFELSGLEYGRGAKKQPTIWCCGDLVPRDPPALVEDDSFRRFDYYLTAQRRTKGCYEGQCHMYEVTATLTGRFDSAPMGRCAFGHLGAYCGRLMIESVSDVVAASTPR